MASSLSDVLSTIQNGVIALNNMAAQIKGSFNNILSRFVTDETNIATNTANIASLIAGPLTAGNVATQADQETATSTSLAVTPGLQKYNPSHPKAWAYVTVAAGVYTLAGSQGVTGIAKNGVGDVTVTFSTAFSSVNFACVVGCNVNLRTWAVTVRTTTTVRLVTTDDLAGFDLTALGDQ